MANGTQQQVTINTINRDKPRFLSDQLGEEISWVNTTLHCHSCSTPRKRMYGVLFQQARLRLYTGTLNMLGITGRNSSGITLEGLDGTNAPGGGSGKAASDEVFGVRRLG